MLNVILIHYRIEAAHYRIEAAHYKLKTLSSSVKVQSMGFTLCCFLSLLFDVCIATYYKCEKMTYCLMPHRPMRKKTSLRSVLLLRDIFKKPLQPVVSPHQLKVALIFFLLIYLFFSDLRSHLFALRVHIHLCMRPESVITVDRSLPWPIIYNKHAAKQQKMSLARQSAITVNKKWCRRSFLELSNCPILLVTVVWGQEGKNREKELIPIYVKLVASCVFIAFHSGIRKPDMCHIWDKNQI